METLDDTNPTPSAPAQTPAIAARPAPGGPADDVACHGTSLRTCTCSAPSDALLHVRRSLWHRVSPPGCLVPVLHSTTSVFPCRPTPSRQNSTCPRLRRRNPRSLYSAQAILEAVSQIISATLITKSTCGPDMLASFNTSIHTIAIQPT